MKVKIESGNAPKAIGPYSQAVLVDDTLYVSGNIPVNPATGDVADGIVNQSKQVFENMKAVLNEAGMGFENVVKTTAFLTDLSNFATFNEIYASYFVAPYPARSCVEVSKLPKNVLVEVECIAKK
ncbi:endoribonuclease L-PSP putative [Clostridium sp. CAG:349]|mgnify:FL=1|jgi:2-iminobutanoate/2-iminopropanoate deaminase|nr:RidA family protein [Clostridium sp.]MCI6976808.1 RidA family protein [Clostridiales bacterium]MDY2971093.1 RidA family protein [Eubacteriales bacterium]MEE0399377.1 RidA family protein [Christensenellales bacterium]CDD09206.1 endoribonuclease L-PSP putative [Clostridium sp. CAG:349]